MRVHQSLKLIVFLLGRSGGRGLKIGDLIWDFV